MKLAIWLTNLCFLFFAFTADLSLVRSDAEPVLDSNGEPLVPGREYYIESAIWPGAGEVKLGRTGNSACPVSVVQASSDLEHGDPVEFTIPGTSHGVISPGTPLKIAFTKKPDCAESSNWVIAKDSNKEWVVIGGHEDHPNSKLVHGYFKIEKVGITGIFYYLLFCPTVTSLSGSCSYIGRFSQDGIRRLYVDNDAPFLLMFISRSAGKSKI